jgi:hypothetical protein
MECQTELDPAKPFSSFFLKDEESIRRKPSGFGFSGLLDFLFLSCLKGFFAGCFVIFFDVPSGGFGFSTGLAQG